MVSLFLMLVSAPFRAQEGASSLCLYALCGHGLCDRLQTLLSRLLCCPLGFQGLGLPGPLA